MNKTQYSSKGKLEMNNKVNLLNIDQAYLLIIFVNDVENFHNIHQNKDEFLSQDELNLSSLIQKFPH